MGIPTGVNYPTTLDTLTDGSQLFGDPTNQIQLTLLSTITSGATTFQVNEDISDMHVPTFLAFATGEIVCAETITPGTGTFSNVTRAAVPQSHNTGEAIRQVFTAEYVIQFKRAIVAIETELGTLPKGASADVKTRLDIATAFIAQKGVATGLASLNAASLVVQNPAISASTATGNAIPIADSSAHLDTWISAMSDTVPGKVEAAIISETDTGTDATRAVTPDGLAGSNFGERIVVFCLNGAVALTTSDMAQFRVSSSMTGMNLVEVAMHCGKDGSSGAPVTNPITVSIQNGTTNMLSTNVTIDATEYDTSTAATPAVIDTAHDDIATGNVINVEVVSTGTAATYVEVVCVFRLP